MERAAVERLKWRSRRGLLELDLVLTRFWAGEGRGMDAAEAAALERLLQWPDNDLLDAVMGRGAPPDDEAERQVMRKLQAA